MIRLRPKIKIDAAEHLKQPLRVHRLLSDFELEDVWKIPVTLNSTHTLQMFIDQFNGITTGLANRGLAGALFRIRLFIGRLFKWDEKQMTDRLIPGSLRHRYAQQENLKYEELPDPGCGDFIPVYKLENEFISEIENSTVHAALHLSRVPSGPAAWTIHMAVYVKPKRLLGRLYMLSIKPFRVWIVYPSLMKAVKKRWEGSLKSSSSAISS